MKRRLYVVTRFASEANRRNMQLLHLGLADTESVLVRQETGGTYRHASELSVRQRPRFTKLSRVIGGRRLERWLDRQLYFPSPAVLYLRPALERLERTVSEDLAWGKEVCVVTPVPPHDLIIVGLHLKRRFPCIRWIIDWQDLWSGDPYYWHQLSRWRRPSAAALERGAAQECDLNVVTNRFAATEFKTRCRVTDAQVVVIPHAFEGAVRSDSDAPPNPQLTIGFLGNLFKPPKVPGQRVLKALDMLREQGFGLRLEIVGDRYLQATNARPVARYDWIVVRPPLSHFDALHALVHCDALLLVLADVPGARAILHAKLPVYLQLRRPIFAIVPDPSAAAAVVRETGAGYVIDANENWTHGMAWALSHHQPQEWKASWREAAVEWYSWKRIQKEWLAVVDPRSAEPATAPGTLQDKGTA